MITVEKWQGLITNASPYAVPGGGFVVQDNMQCLRPGQIECRAGYQVVSGSGDGTGVVVAVAQMSATTVVFVTSDGGVHSVGVSL